MSNASLETLRRQLRDAVARASIEVTRQPQWDGRPLHIPAIAAPAAKPECQTIAEAMPVAEKVEVRARNTSYAISKELAPRYVPTEEEIRMACDQLQAGWSERERRARYAAAHSIRSLSEIDTVYTIPTVAVSDVKAA